MRSEGCQHSWIWIQRIIWLTTKRSAARLKVTCQRPRIKCFINDPRTRPPCAEQWENKSIIDKFYLFARILVPWKLQQFLYHDKFIVWSGFSINICPQHYKPIVGAGSILPFSAFLWPRTPACGGKRGNIHDEWSQTLTASQHISNTHHWVRYDVLL